MMATSCNVCDVVKTELCPDVLQWNEQEQLLLVGTYELNKETERKHGALGLATLTAQGGTAKLSLQSWLPAPAVFDAKWLIPPHGHDVQGQHGGNGCDQGHAQPSLVAAAMHDGTVRLYALDRGSAGGPPVLRPHGPQRSSVVYLSGEEAWEDNGDAGAASALYVDWAVKASGQQDPAVQLAVDDWMKTMQSLCSDDEDGGEEAGLHRVAEERATEGPGGTDSLAALPPLAVSSADGTVHILTSDSEGGVRPTVSWLAHTLAGAAIEAWVVSWYRAAHARLGTVLWSGGDDGKLKGWDVRCMGGSVVRTGSGRYSVSSPRPLFTSDAHSAGVTCIEWHPTRDNLVATGSYDETLCIWDCRRMAEPVSASVPGRLCSSFCAGGGVWRVAWSPLHASPGTALVGCMYNGVHMLHWPEMAASSSSEELQCISTLHYKVHSTISYPVQWLAKAASGQGEESMHAVTAGFYDKEVHLLQVTGL